MERLIISAILLITFSMINGCEPKLHNPDDPRFLIINNTANNISFKSYYRGVGDTGETIISSNEEDFTGGGGIIDVDSVLFVRKSNNDSLIYRNAKHGDDVFSGNHFFNFDNWVERDKNEFYYSVNDEDFDN